MLSIENVSIEFGGIRAVDDCSFEVERGSITGLIGPNGAGKTTLFNLVSGFLRPNRGRIHFDGRRIDGLRPHEIARLGLVRTFQVPRALAGMSVLDNVLIAGRSQAGERIWRAWWGKRRIAAEEKALKERAQEILTFLTLDHLAHEYAGNLSVGQKKLLELARSLMAGARMILLDEPAAGVNPTLMARIVEHIKALQRQGTTFLLIEHDIDLVMGMCDRVVVMNQGALLTQGPPEQVRKDPAVIEAYLGG